VAEATVQFQPGISMLGFAVLFQHILSDEEKHQRAF
jgi:hypothetical protein